MQRTRISLYLLLFACMLTAVASMKARFLIGGKDSFVEQGGSERLLLPFPGSSLGPSRCLRIKVLGLKRLKATALNHLEFILTVGRLYTWQ